jgi:hypothetical protein
MEYKDMPSNIMILNIITHRANLMDTTYTDYLVRVACDNEININGFDTVQDEQCQGKFIYDVWIKDTVSIGDYYRSLSFISKGFFVTRALNMAHKIHKYCRRLGFNMLYVYMHKEIHFPNNLSREEFEIVSGVHDDNYRKQVESLRYLCELFPNHKVIREDYHSQGKKDYTYERIFLNCAMKIMQKGDIFYTFNLENQHVKESDIILFNMTLENTPPSYDEERDIERQHGRQLTLNETRNLTKDNITLLDREFYNKKVSIDTLVLATSKRLGENSSLRVLPPHLLREIGRWF